MRGKKLKKICLIIVGVLCFLNIPNMRLHAETDELSSVESQNEVYEGTGEMENQNTEQDSAIIENNTLNDSSAENVETEENNNLFAEEDDDPQYWREMENRNTYSEEILGADTNFTGSSVQHDSKFNDYIVMSGVDVSKYQGDIDWAAAKAAGVEFAFIRVGYRGYSGGNLVEDPYYRKNMEGALAAGIQVGIYIFSQAITNDEAIEEANFAIDRLAGYSISLPVVIDYEYAGDGKGRLYNAHLSVDAATSVCNSFCNQSVARGYKPMVYANKSMLENNLCASRITAGYDIWLANYTNKTSYAGDYTFWQYSSKGRVNGINGNVDCDYWYMPKDGLIKQNDGNMCYYTNNKVNTSYTGLAQNGSDWYAVKDGHVNSGYTGLVNNDQGWWYVENGKVNFDYYGLKPNEYGWWNIYGGQVVFDYTGLVNDPTQGWWYVENGKVNFDYYGLKPNEYGWWNIYGGQVVFDYTGLVNDSTQGWWYVENGKVNFDYYGLKPNEYGWWNIYGGQVVFDYTGLVNDPTQGWWYVENGKVNFDYYGLKPNGYGWWNIYGGQVVFDYTGLVNDPTQGWWYVENGKVNFDFTGLVNKNEEIWYVNKGAVDFYYNGQMEWNGKRYTIVNGYAIQQ